jgi:7-cyano-7-deazaguanine synthase
MNDQRAVYNVFWTSGWDSTFTVIQHIRQGARVRPYYVYDECRASRDREVERMKELAGAISQRYGHTGGNLEKVRIIQKNKIPHSFSAYMSYKALKRRGRLGRQYFWLGRLTRQLKGTALSAHRDGAVDLFTRGKLVDVSDGDIGKRHVLDPGVKDKHLRRLFGNMVFPVITMTKRDMRAIAEREGFLDLLHNTWFCHNAGTTPCGECNPCKALKKFDMAYRLKGN